MYLTVSDSRAIISVNIQQVSSPMTGPIFKTLTYLASTSKSTNNCKLVYA